MLARTFLSKKAPAPLLAKCNQRVINNSIGQMMDNTQNARVKSIPRLKKQEYIKNDCE